MLSVRNVPYKKIYNYFFVSITIYPYRKLDQKHYIVGMYTDIVYILNLLKWRRKATDCVKNTVYTYIK